MLKSLPAGSTRQAQHPLHVTRANSRKAISREEADTSMNSRSQNDGRGEGGAAMVKKLAGVTNQLTDWARKHRP
jgi:hypothetical protein